MNIRVRSTQQIVLTGMFTAVLAVLSQIQIPMPSGMPLTLQTYAVALIGFMLGSRQGAASVGVYILIGAVGLPVFTGFRGGVNALMGTTGGFIWGFLFLAAGCGVMSRKTAGESFRKTDRSSCPPVIRILGPLLGLLICHLIGSLQFSFVMQTDFLQAVLLVSAPYVIKDIFSVFIAYATMKAARKRLGTMQFCA